MRVRLAICLSLVLSGCVSQPDSESAQPDFLQTEMAPDRDALVYPDAERVPVVYAAFETRDVDTLDDAADDPAIWINPLDPAASLVLGTDKNAGVAVYDLWGNLKQFLPIGEPNNIDLRANVTLADWQGDLAIASNRLNDTISILGVTADGIESLGEFPSALPEPYGACLGNLDNTVLVFVTYKNGMTLVHRLDSIGSGTVSQQLVGQIAFSGQLEGCVVDETNRVIHIGEEETGAWRSSLTFNNGLVFFGFPYAVDRVGSESGIVADVEGITIYERGGERYLIVSSQENDSYAVYNANGDNTFLGRFRIGAGDVLDGAQETDGIAATGVNLGPRFPVGIFVAQDGFNAPAGSRQNFKVVDWRDIAEALGLSAR